MVVGSADYPKIPVYPGHLIYERSGAFVFKDGEKKNIDLPECQVGVARSISNNGIVVGDCSYESSVGPSTTPNVVVTSPFIWDAQNGPRRLKDVISTGAPDFTFDLDSALSVNSDGNTIAGTFYRTEYLDDGLYSRFQRIGAKRGFVITTVKTFPAADRKVTLRLSGDCASELKRRKSITKGKKCTFEANIVDLQARPIDKVEFTLMAEERSGIFTIPMAVSLTNKKGKSSIKLKLPKSKGVFQYKALSGMAESKVVAVKTR